MKKVGFLVDESQLLSRINSWKVRQIHCQLFGKTLKLCDRIIRRSMERNYPKTLDSGLNIRFCPNAKVTMDEMSMMDIPRMNGLRRPQLDVHVSDSLPRVGTVSRARKGAASEQRERKGFDICRCFLSYEVKLLKSISQRLRTVSD